MADPRPALGATISHYRILGKIGAGGMGEVYRAHDEQLDRDVALKVLPSGMLLEETARKSFRKEALALAKLNHPNIETIFEFSSDEGVDFLAMELIPGRPLNEKIREGPLAEKEILRLGVQLLDGLAAAHNQGVIHRDLKPANVFVTPEGRVKILDFGLAKLVHPEGGTDVTRSITTDTGIVSGTVPYMAPEQLRGEATDARSDIYAAGAVLYEMATCQRPFPQTQGPQLMGAILHEPPAPPSAANPGVSPGLENAILKALEKEPARRYQTAKEFEAVLESIGAAQVSGSSVNISEPGVAVARGAPGKESRSASFWIWASGAVLVVVLGLLVALNVGGWRDRTFQASKKENAAAVNLPGASTSRRSIAVLGFKNLSARPEEAWLSTALSEMLTTELAAGEQLRTIAGENVARMKIDLSLADADAYGKETLGKIGKNLGSDDVVLGSYIPLDSGQIRLDLRLQDTGSGETMAAVSDKGAEAQLDVLVGRVGLALRQKLGVGEISQAEAAAVKASLPSDPQAARAFSEGLAKARVFDNLAARDLLQKAVGIEPRHAPSHSALAAAWLSLGYDEKATAEAKLAFDLSAGLSRADRLSVEGHYRESTHEWDKAVEIYKTLFGFFPDNLDYGILLAQAQIRAGNGAAGLETVKNLRTIPGVHSNDSRIDLTEALAAQSIADYTHAQDAATRAADKGKVSGARLVVARARLIQGVALRNLGKPKEALAASEDAEQIYAAAGDRAGVASALNNAANILLNEGDDAAAKRKYEAALAIYREIGNKTGAAKMLDNTATTVSDLGDLSGARKLSEQALVLFRETGDNVSIANALNNIATDLTLEGDLSQATSLFQQSLKIRQEIGDKGGQASSLNNLAELLTDQGDLAGAKTAFEESLRLHRDAGQKNDTAFPLVGLGNIAMYGGDLTLALQHFQESEAVARETEQKPLLPQALASIAEVFLQQGRIAEAGEKLESALAIDTELSYKAEGGEIRSSLARVKIEAGQIADAKTLIQDALKEAVAEKLVDDELRAKTILARVLLAEGKVADAAKEIDSAKALATKNQNRIVRLDLSLADALVQSGLGKHVQALAIAKAALSDADKFGLVMYQLQARLAMGQIEIKLGNTEAGRAQLAALEKDARAKEFLLIARRASQQ